MGGLDVVVAGIHIAIVFNRWSIAACRRMDAEFVASEIGLERHVEELDVDPAHVLANPFLEDINQKTPVLFGLDGALGYQAPRLCVEQSLSTRALAPAQIRDGKCLRRRALDDRNELHPLRMQFVAKETVHVAAVVSVRGVDGAEDV